jgi:hypothetical protein
MLILRDWIDINKINWKTLSSNPNAIELLKKNKNKINWEFLSRNPNAIELLKENQHKINWLYLSENQNAIELMAFIFHPKNMNKWNNWGFTEHQEFIEFNNNK